MSTWRLFWANLRYRWAEGRDRALTLTQRWQRVWSSKERNLT